MLIVLLNVSFSLMIAGRSYWFSFGVIDCQLSAFKCPLGDLECRKMLLFVRWHFRTFINMQIALLNVNEVLLGVYSPYWFYSSQKWISFSPKWSAKGANEKRFLQFWLGKDELRCTPVSLTEIWTVRLGFTSFIEHYNADYHKKKPCLLWPKSETLSFELVNTFSFQFRWWFHFFFAWRNFAWNHLAHSMASGLLRTAIIFFAIPRLATSAIRQRIEWQAVAKNEGNAATKPRRKRRQEC